MSSNSRNPTSRSIDIDENTVRKHGVHDGEMDIEHERIVPLAIDEVTGRYEVTGAGVADD